MRRVLVLATAALVAALLVGRADADLKYRYGKLIEATSVVVSLDRANPEGTGHASVWLGTQDKNFDWIQVGLMYYPASGMTQPCVYAETMTEAVYAADGLTVLKQADYMFRCVKSVAWGQKVRLRLTFSNRHGEVVWADGVALASASLTPIATYATTERYGSVLGMRATITPGQA